MKKSVIVFVGQGMADWEAGFAVAGLNSPGLFGVPEALYDVRYATTDGGPKRTMGGLTIQPDLALDDVQPAESAMPATIRALTVGR